MSVFFKAAELSHTLIFTVLYMIKIMKKDSPAKNKKK